MFWTFVKGCLCLLLLPLNIVSDGGVAWWVKNDKIIVATTEMCYGCLCSFSPYYTPSSKNQMQESFSFSSFVGYRWYAQHTHETSPRGKGSCMPIFQYNIWISKQNRKSPISISSGEFLFNKRSRLQSQSKPLVVKPNFEYDFSFFPPFSFCPIVFHFYVLSFFYSILASKFHTLFSLWKTNSDWMQQNHRNRGTQRFIEKIQMFGTTK